jgi:hypothetical protein
MVVKTISDACDAFKVAQEMNYHDGDIFIDKLIRTGIPFEMVESGEVDTYDPRFRPFSVNEAKDRYAVDGKRCVDPLFRKCFEVYDSRRRDFNLDSFGQISVPITDFVNVLYLTERAIMDSWDGGIFLQSDDKVGLPDFFENFLIGRCKDSPGRLGILEPDCYVDPLSRLSMHIPNLRRLGTPSMEGGLGYQVLTPRMDLKFHIRGDSGLFGEGNNVKGLVSFGKDPLHIYEFWQNKLDEFITEVSEGKRTSLKK